jgi:hypothetical protein
VIFGIDWSDRAPLLAGREATRAASIPYAGRGRLAVLRDHDLVGVPPVRSEGGTFAFLA